MQNFCSGIHVLVEKNGEFLLLKRSMDDVDDPEHWDLPGGGIEFNEQPLDAAIREAKEEAGIGIKITQLLTVWAQETEHNHWSIELLAYGIHQHGDIQLSHEHSAHQWVSKEALLSISPKSRHLEALIQHSLDQTLFHG